MTIQTMTLKFQTRGHAHIIDITGETVEIIENSSITSGIVTLFVPGSTAALTTIEYEPGALKDFQRMFEELAPKNRTYDHNERWGDGNGHSHMQASLLGPSLTVPFSENELLLGTWQQIIFVDFDVRPRTRTVILQVMGE